MEKNILVKALDNLDALEYMGHIHVPCNMFNIYRLDDESSYVVTFDDMNQYKYLFNYSKEFVEFMCTIHNAQEILDYLRNAIDDCVEDETTRDITWMELDAKFILECMDILNIK